MIKTVFTRRFIMPKEKKEAEFKLPEGECPRGFMQRLTGNI